ncbi:MAG: hypothetical protein ACYTG0_28380 [Planctomycetota bacterium]|jgi:hypothetical protein
MLTVPERVFWIFNLCEGMLWVVIAVWLAVVYRRGGQSDNLILAGSLLFFAFGISDFVEMQTDAWYRPWWLFAWKASNLAGLLAVYVLFRRRGSRRRAAPLSGRPETK